MSKDIISGIRSYFDLRYAFPGYIFLFIIVIIYNDQLNYQIPPIFSSINIFTVIATISGAPLGFIISQIWYFTEEIRRIKPIRNLYDRLIISNNDIKPPLENLHYSQIINIIDYLFPQHKCDNLKNYVTRRWDLYNILGSTFISLWIGLSSIYSIKYAILKQNINISLILIETSIIIILSCLLCDGIRKNIIVHDEMVLLMVNEVIYKKRIYLRYKFHHFFPQTQ